METLAALHASSTLMLGTSLFVLQNVAHADFALQHLSKTIKVLLQVEYKTHLAGAQNCFLPGNDVL